MIDGALTRRSLLTAILGSVALSSDSADGQVVRVVRDAGPAGPGTPNTGGRARAGVNLPPFAWYWPLRTMTNLAAYGGWQADAGPTMADPAVIDANGDIVSFPHGVGTFQKGLALPSTSRPVRCRIECTGAPIDRLVPQNNEVSDETRGTDRSVDPPIHWYEFTYHVDLDAYDSAHPYPASLIVISSPDVRNLFCAEVAGRSSGGKRTPFLETGFWHSRFVEIVSAFGEIRFLDPSNVIGDCGRDFARPVTAANRARRRQAAPPNAGTGTNQFVGWPKSPDNPCRVTAGGLTLVAADRPIGGAGMIQIAAERLAAIQHAPASVTALPGVSEYMPYGASGNAMTLVVTPPSGAGSVTFDPLSLTLTVTPAPGAETGAWIRAQLSSAADPRVGAVIDVGASTGTEERVPPGTYRFAGGQSPQMQGDLGIEEAVDLCIAARCNLHWCLPIAVADDYLALVARELARLIPHGLHADVEVGNEIWNTAFNYQWWQLLVRGVTRNPYDFPKGQAILYGGYEHVLQTVVQMTDHAHSVMAPFFASAPHALRFCLNLQRGNMEWTLGQMRRTSPSFAAAYDRVIDVNMSACYVNGADEVVKLDGPTPWAAGRFNVGDVVVDAGTVYVASQAGAGSNPPHTDAAYWHRLADDQAAIARILKANVDGAIAQRALDFATSRALGKAYKVYEGSFEIGGCDQALVRQLTEGAGAAEAMTYLIDRFHAQCGADTPFLWYCLAYKDDRGWALGHTTESLPSPLSRAMVAASA